MWMTLEPVLQDEISQKMKSEYINTYIWNPENGTHEPTCRVEIEVQREWTCGHGRVHTYTETKLHSRANKFQSKIYHAYSPGMQEHGTEH